MISRSIKVFVLMAAVLSQSSAAFLQVAPLTSQTTTLSHRPADKLSPLPLNAVEKYTTKTQLHVATIRQSAPQVYSLPELSPMKASLTKAGMVAFVASMCVALPVTLFPPWLLHKARIISTSRKEKASLRIGQFCSRWLMRVIPFAKIKVLSEQESGEPEPSIWVCNHTSMLDIFFLLATDKKLRGRKKRPIKIIYWKDLEKNPVTGLLFKMCGFIPVEMEDNGNGNQNQYKMSSFKGLLKGVKKAFDEGWDIGILPEGQLNPSPENGLQPIYSGAFTMARMSKRPIRMLGLHGLHKLWHGVDGMTVTGREVKVRAYPAGRKFDNADDFVESFQNIVGYFGAKGDDHPELQKWMDGTAWKEMTARKQTSPKSSDAAKN